MSRVNRAITASDERVHLVALYDFFLDDAGLNPFEYRAYMRIVRRAGGGRSACTESLENMAIGCRMSRRAMVGAIKALIKRHMIRRESKSGHVSTYVLTDKSTWVLDETTWAPDAQVEGEGWAPYAQGVGTVCPGGGHHMPTKNTNKNTRKNTKSSGAKAPSRNPYYDCFAKAYEAKFNYPYQSKSSDFIQYNKWKKIDLERTDEALFEKAVSNYLASPQGKYTFADLVTRFAVFRHSALDRFGKPLANEKPPTPGSAAPLPRKTCGRCVNGYIMPTNPGDRATRCSCQEVKNAITAS